MRHGGGFRLLGILLAIGLVAALTAGAYSAGFVAGAGSSATNASPWVYGGAFGASGIIGLFVTVLILVVIFRIMRFAFWGHAYRGWDRHGPGAPGGPGGPGEPGEPGGWGWPADHWHSRRQAMFDDWHRRAHGGTAGSPPAGGASQTGQEAR